MDYQRFYFDEKFIKKKIENLYTIEIFNGKLKINKMVNIHESTQ